MIIPTLEELQNKTKPLYGSRLNVITLQNIYFNIFGVDMMIPAGFRSDGASIPWILTIFLDPFDPRILFWALVHDYIYRTQFMPRLIADAILKEGIHLSGSWIWSVIFYYTLRPTGWLAWIRNKRKGLEQYPEAKQQLKDYICKKND